MKKLKSRKNGIVYFPHLHDFWLAILLLYFIQFLEGCLLQTTSIKKLKSVCQKWIEVTFLWLAKWFLLLILHRGRYVCFEPGKYWNCIFNLQTIWNSPKTFVFLPRMKRTVLNRVSGEWQCFFQICFQNYQFLWSHTFICTSIGT